MRERLVTYNGVQMLLTEAMRLAGCTLAPSTVFRRVVNGWPLLAAMSMPPMTRAGVRDRIRPFPEVMRGGA